MTIFANKTAATPPSPAHQSQDGRPRADSTRSGHIGWIVIGSLAIGALAAALLAAAPFIPATEAGVSGGILLGLALGWIMLSILSTRLTDQPQKWAAVPALALGLGGVLLMAFGAPMNEPLSWVLPATGVVLAVWMGIRIHRHLPSRIGRVLLYPVIVMLAVASLSGGYETVREGAHAGASPSQGQLIDVGGHRLYLHCTGSGSPTVVIEPGAGMMASDLDFIAPVVDRDTRVCVYDRAGRGWSDPAPTEQDGAEVATDLHTLLQRGNEPGPYVLAGHSFGGLYALTFTAAYPEDVAGLVLVDSTAPASERDPAPPQASRADDTMNRLSALGTAGARLGLGRVLGIERPSHLQGTIDEYLHAGSSARQAAALETFGDKPLVVLTAGIGGQPGWAASQDALASLSSNSLHRVIDGSTHASLVTDEEDAAATVRGILDAVSAVRMEGPLTP